jgi:hypothetical protein
MVDDWIQKGLERIQPGEGGGFILFRTFASRDSDDEPCDGNGGDGGMTSEREQAKLAGAREMFSTYSDAHAIQFSPIIGSL